MRYFALNLILSTRTVFTLLAYCIFYTNPAVINYSHSLVVSPGIIVQGVINYPVG
jgi:hypothetical protein